MFNRNKREYLKAIEKIKVPDIVGVENSKKKKNNISKKIIAAASICFVFTMSMLGNNISTGNSNNSFVVKAYATTNEGSKSIDLEKGKIVKMPSDGNEISLQGLLIDGDNIKNIKISSKGSGIIYSGSSNEIFTDLVTNFTDEVSVTSIILTNSNDETSVSNSVENIEEGGENTEYLNVSDDNFMLNKIDDDLKQENEVISVEYETSDDINSVNINNIDGLKYHYISWQPNEELLKKIENKEIKDYSTIEPEEININVTFKDGTVQEGKLQMSFDENGEMIAKLL
ncbi:MAG: hypothetical protein SPE00_07285 [Bacilli bacterium]|nr:hypothetical protein [Bacilli bacterium]